MLEIAYSAYSAESTWNDKKWKHERFVELLKASKTEVDEDRRRELCREMQVLVRGDGGAVIPMYADFVIAASSTLRSGLGYSAAISNHARGSAFAGERIAASCVSPHLPVSSDEL